MASTKKFPWRRWNNILHRDIGYIIVGLTLIYGISGIAVNHTADWNPNYRIEKTMVKIEPLKTSEHAEMEQEALSKLKVEAELQNSFRPDSQTFQLFFEGKTYSIDIPTGNVLVETTQPRRVLYEMNQLHLNTPKRLWTYIADLYAFSLIVVALTGLFVLKGKTGITGRGAWLTTIGVLLPTVYWFYYLYFSD